MSIDEEIDEDFYIERELIDSIDEDDDHLSEKSLEWREEYRDVFISKNFDEICTEADKSKMILLSDYAGAGKSTTFKHWSVKLKEKFPLYWISYIDLKKHLHIFEKYERKFQLQEVLIEILNITDEENFKKNFISNTVILLFDGVDEISPKFKDFFMNLIQIIQSSTSNQQWIATRPLCTQEMIKKFNTKAYMLKPFDESTTIEFMDKIIKKSKCEDVNAYIVQQSYCSLSLYDKINAPLMIQMMIELFIKDRENSKRENFYKLYEQMIEIKRETAHEKGVIVVNDCKNLNSKLTIWQVHQIYALKSLYSDEFKDPLAKYEDDDASDNKYIDFDEFSMFKQWKIEKLKWTPEAISRYGILIVDQYGTPIFVHRTFAEFFAAQFVIQTTYNGDENDAELAVKLFISSSLSIWNFISSGFDNLRPKILSDYFLKITTSKKMQKLISENLLSDVDENVEDLVKIFSIDERFLKEFKFEDNERIFQKKFLKAFECSSHDYPFQMMKIYEKSLGSEWMHYIGFTLKDEIVNFPSDEEINQIFVSDFVQTTNDEDEFYRDYVRSRCSEFYKLFCLIERVDIPQSCLLNLFSKYEHMFLDYSPRNSQMLEKTVKFIENIFIDCKDKFYETIRRNYFEKTTFSAGLNQPTEEYAQNVAKFGEKLEEFLNTDSKFFRAGIFVSFCRIKILIDSKEKFKYCTQNELQEFLIKFSACFIQNMCDNISDHFYNSFEFIMREVFLKSEDSGKMQLRKFLENRYEYEDNTSLFGHTVFSIVDDRIINRQVHISILTLRKIKNILIKLAKKVDITNEEIKKLSKRKYD